MSVIGGFVDEGLQKNPSMTEEQLLGVHMLLYVLVESGHHYSDQLTQEAL